VDGPFSTQREVYGLKPRQHIVIRGARGGPRLKSRCASALSRFSSHFARPNGYLDSDFLVRISPMFKPYCMISNWSRQVNRYA